MLTYEHQFYDIAQENIEVGQKSISKQEQNFIKIEK